MSYAYHLQPLKDIHLKSNLRYDASSNGSLARVKVFSIVGAIILLLACINYINLTTAGAVRRAKETAIRKVIGAVKGQLQRQFFIETFVICTIAVLFGLLLFKTILPAFGEWIGQPYHFPITLKTVGIIVAFILLVSFIAGIYPAAILSSFHPVTTLKGSFFQSTRGNILRKGLVVFQFTITIALVASIFIINQQTRYIKSKSLGFDKDAVIEVNFHGDSSVINQYATIRNELLKIRAFSTLVSIART
jgi:putative ABC transport system permease protein